MPRLDLRLLALAFTALAAFAAPAQARDPVPLSAHDFTLLNRISWGASPSSADELQALGAAPTGPSSSPSSRAS